MNDPILGEPPKRTYQPQAHHFGPCPACGKDCTPYPHEWSPQCSVCWYEKTCRVVERMQANAVLPDRP